MIAMSQISVPGACVTAQAHYAPGRVLVRPISLRGYCDDLPTNRAVQVAGILKD